jgi:hypothetical protein
LNAWAWVGAVMLVIGLVSEVAVWNVAAGCGRRGHAR